MTKTLTEQWREGTLPVGTYYIVNQYGDEEIDVSVAVGELWNNTVLKEVLAPVPSYDEFKRLQEQLNEANELLKTAGYGSKENIYPLPYVCPEECRNYLEKWGVK